MLNVATLPNYSLLIAKLWILALVAWGVWITVRFWGSKVLGALRLRRSTRFRHIKRGSTYTLVTNFCELQTSRPVREGEMLTVYRAADGKLWARPSMEFHDGRFEQC